MNQLATSLWGDESFTAVAVSKSLPEMLAVVMRDTAPPLHYLLLFVWTRIFGNSEVSLRSLSILFYLATVFLAYLIAKVIWDKKTGILAALLTFSNPFLFVFAFEARMYALLVFTICLSFYFFFTKKNLGYILASTAALYSHHYSVLALAFQFFWRLIETKNLKKNWLKFLKPYLAIALLYLPWLYPLYKQTTLVATGFWLGKPQLKDIPNLLVKYLKGEIYFSWQKYLPILALITLFFKNWRSKLKQNFFLLGWVVFPVIFAYLASLGKTSIFYDRYLIFIIPGMMILLSEGLKKIPLRLVVLLLFPLMWLNFYYFTHPTKRPFKQLKEYVKQEVGADDFLVNYNGKAHHLWETKYYGLEAPLYAPELVGKGNLPYYVGTAQMTDKDIIKDLPKKERIGVISSEEPNSMILKGYKLQTYQRFGALTFSWFVKEES